MKNRKHWRLLALSLISHFFKFNFSVFRSKWQLFVQEILLRIQRRTMAGTDSLLIWRCECIESNVFWEEDSNAVVLAGQRGLSGAADVDCFWQRLLAGAGRQACLYVLTGCLLCWSKCRLALTLMYTDKAVRVNSEGSERGGGRHWLPYLAHLSDDGNKRLMNHSESGRQRSQRERSEGWLSPGEVFFLRGCFYLAPVLLSGIFLVLPQARICWSAKTVAETCVEPEGCICESRCESTKTEAFVVLLL